METNAGSPANHPLYDRIQAQVQAQDWSGALANLRMLRASFPYDPGLERLQTLIETQAAEEEAEGTTAATSRRWGLRLLALLLILALGGGLLLAAALVYDRLAARPIPEAESPEADRARQIVRLALASGDCRQAEESYRDLLRLAPADKALEMELDHCRQRLTLDSLYAQGVAALHAGDWDAARAAFGALERQAPDYRDLTAEIGYLERQQQIKDRWAEAQAACRSRQWEACVAHLQAVQGADLHFRRDEVQSLLYEATLQAGRLLVARSGDDRQALDRAIAYFDLALQQKPASREALWEREMAAAYAQSWRWFEQQAWEAAANRLAALYALQPGYAGGHLAQRLYLSRLRQGDALAAQGDLIGAAAAYRAAVRVKEVDTTQAQAALDRLAVLLTPTPVPSATITPTQTAVATPKPRPTSRPAPTLTSTPLPYRFFSYGATLTAAAACDSLTVQGWVRDEAGPVPGVEVAIWTDTWQGPIVVTDADGYYYYYLDNHPKLGTWSIKLSMGGQQISDVVLFSTRPDCNANLVYISWESRY